MKNKKGLIIIAGILAVLLLGAYVLYDKLGEEYRQEQLGIVEDTQEPSSQAVPAPDFTVYDAEGNEVKLSNYFGTPIVLNFWASWCGPCRSEMPEFNETYLELDGSVMFLMVNVTGGRETEESAKKYVEESGYSFPVFYDLKLDAASTYGASSLPTTFFINADGELTAWAAGAIDRKILQKGLDMILP